MAFRSTLVRRVYRIQLSTRSNHSNSFQQRISTSFIQYCKRLKWVPIPIGVGFAYIGYQQYRHVRERELSIIQRSQSPEELLAKDWQVRLYCALPLNAVSRVWGRLCALELPVWLRSPLFKLYIRVFNCNLAEAREQDLTQYESVSKFFRRRLKPECRPISKQHQMVSPCDGKILYYGPVVDGRIEQVKGITYDLANFLGHPAPVTPAPGQPAKVTRKTVEGSMDLTLTDAYESSLKHHPGNRLYHCTIYLSPADCHVFHSPTNFTLNAGRHFPGHLLSVSVPVARWVRGLFAINERVVYTGSWMHGFFAMAAVGATNVGSINCFHDKTLVTNQKGPREPREALTFIPRPIEASEQSALKGKEFGEFNFGSTIVLIFEAPENFTFRVPEGGRVKYGEPLGDVDSSNSLEKLRPIGK